MKRITIGQKGRYSHRAHHPRWRHPLILWRSTSPPPARERCPTVSVAPGNACAPRAPERSINPPASQPQRTSPSAYAGDPQRSRRLEMRPQRGARTWRPHPSPSDPRACEPDSLTGGAAMARPPVTSKSRATKLAFRRDEHTFTEAHALEVGQFFRRLRGFSATAMRALTATAAAGGELRGLREQFGMRHRRWSHNHYAGARERHQQELRRRPRRLDPRLFSRFGASYRANICRTCSPSDAG
jgi:hypothetical protein